MKYNIYIDDIRVKPDRYDLLFKSGEEFVEWLNGNKGVEISLISFDHDLGENYMNGVELIHELLSMNLHIEAVQFHSDNLPTLPTMYSLFASAKRVGLLPHLKHIHPYKIDTNSGIEKEAPWMDLRPRGMR